MNIEELVKILLNGGLAVIPTDTVYGLIGDATNVKAIKKIYQIKKRENKPLLILVSDMNMLKRYVKNISLKEQEVINKYWPGTLTIVFNEKQNLNDLLTAGQKSIAIRMPNNPELCQLIKTLDKPIIATSANISNQQTITNINLLEPSIKENVDYIYDAGYLENIPSTIIKIENEKIITLREGTIKIY